MRFKQIIVVEGKDDTAAIKRAVEADTIETNGSALNDSVIAQIKLAKQRRGVIIFTDPDYPGERIRRIINEQVPGCGHAFLPKQEAISKNKADLGVENASPEAIRAALQHVKQEYTGNAEVITRQDLFEAGLIAGAHARSRRERLGLLLKIGYANGKQLHKRLMVFAISREEFVHAMVQVVEEEEGG